MSETKREQWKWHYQPDMDGNDTAEIYITDAEGHEILRIDPDMAEVSPAEYVRIARIATAGPELLAACEAALTCITRLELYAINVYDRDMADDVRVTLETAIRKARGE